MIRFFAKCIGKAAPPMSLTDAPAHSDNHHSKNNP